MKLQMKQDHFPRRRGTVVVVTAVSLVTLLLCASLAVDVGYICALTAEQQNNADAGALGGAVTLQEGDSLSVIDRVRDILALNQQRQGYLSLDDQIIEIGYWHPVEQTFTTLSPTEWESRGYAVRVRAFRNNAPLFFAAIMGNYKTDVSREAVAVGSKDCRGIWGLEGVRIPGNVITDSYRSTDGPYDPEKALEDGDVCSGRGIDGMGSIEIHGDMMTGLGYWPTLAGTAGIFSTGITTSSIDGMVAPEVGVPEGMLSQGDLVLKADENLTLAPGSYLFDSITMRARASITVTGPTTIYVSSLADMQADVDIADEGTIDATGRGFVNVTEDPSNFTLVILGDHALLNGNAAFYGTVIAPFAEVILSGTADYYGMALGRTVLMRGNFQFHVDETLPAFDLMKAPPVMLVK